MTEELQTYYVEEREVRILSKTIKAKSETEALQIFAVLNKNIDLDECFEEPEVKAYLSGSTS